MVEEVARLENIRVSTSRAFDWVFHLREALETEKQNRIVL